jgi:hypothetical protein
MLISMELLESAPHQPKPEVEKTLENS